MKKLIIVVLLALSASISIAQSTDACPAIVQTVIESIDQFCADLERNQACYGHTQLNATARPTATNFVFEQSGDIVDLTDLEGITFSPMNVDDDIWGAALMRIQADIPDTLPGENVTILFFGDTEVTSDVPIDSTTHTPMQSFIYRSGIGDSACQEAPDSGFVIQTPEGVESVNLTINGVDISVGSTVYVNQKLQFERTDGEMCFHTLEGEAVLSVDTDSSDVGEGTASCVPINPNTLLASGPPSAPAPILDDVLDNIETVAEGVFQVDMVAARDAAQTFADERGHVVRSGDSIFQLALCYDVTIGEIQAANDLDDYRIIYVGDEIVIPGIENFEIYRFNCTQQTTTTTTGGSLTYDIPLVGTPTPLPAPPPGAGLCLIPLTGLYDETYNGTPGILDINWGR